MALRPNWIILLLLVLAAGVPTTEPPAPPTEALPSATTVPATAMPQPTNTDTAVPPTNTATAVPPTPMPPTPTPPPTPTQEPTAAPAPPPVEAAFNGVRFLLDGRLAEQVYPMEETWGEMTYTVFKFTPEGLCRDVGCIELYDVAAYEAVHPDFPLPPLGAAVILKAQEQKVDFQNGSGARAVLMYGQNGYFANNEALLYEFKGFTADGRFYILITIPIDVPILLTTYDPAQNQNRDAIPVPADLPADSRTLSDLIFQYNQKVKQ